MPSIHLLALWSVVSDLAPQDLERFSRWLASGEQPAIAGPLAPLMAAAGKLPPEDRLALCDFVIAAIAAPYEES